MTVLQATRTKPSSGATRSARLFLLELSGDRIHSMNPGWFRPQNHRHRLPPPRRHRRGCGGRSYLLDQHGRPQPRRRLDRARRPRRQEPQGHRPARRHPHAETDPSREGQGKLYWCDREGMRVMRANLDGSQVETLVETGRGDTDRRDQTRWCVGSPSTRSSGKSTGRKKARTTPAWAASSAPTSTFPRARARRTAPTSRCCSISCRNPSTSSSISTNRVLYWTDRGDPPRGNTVNRAPIDKKAVPEILITHLMEGIGIALDVSGNRMFVTDFAGSVYCADLDGRNERNFLFAQGNLTGIAYAEV